MRGTVPNLNSPWPVIYGVLVMGLGAVASLEIAMPASAARTLLEAVVVLLMYGLAASWLYVRREHLSSEDREPATHTSTAQAPARFLAGGRGGPLIVICVAVTRIDEASAQQTVFSVPARDVRDIRAVRGRPR